MLRRPTLLAATALFISAGALLWRPLPLVLLDGLRAVALSLDGFLYVPALGSMFDAASGFGVRLQRQHQLITAGPYRSCPKAP